MPFGGGWLRRGRYLEGERAAAEEEAPQRGREARLRAHVRAVQAHPPFCREWFALVQSLSHVAGQALEERRAEEALAPSASPHRHVRLGESPGGSRARLLGFGRADGGGSPVLGGAVARGGGRRTTLWERQELAVRFLLEEGKVALCLRMLYKHRRNVGQGSWSESVRAAAEEMETTLDALTRLVATYELALANITQCTFESMECLQTTEPQEVAEYCTFVLRQFCEPEGRCRNDQALVIPVAAVYCVRSFVLQMEACDMEARVLQALAEEETLAALARFMRGRRKQLASHDLFAFAELLEGICGAETFPAVREKLFPPEAMRDLAELKEHFHDHIAHTHARRTAVNKALLLLEDACVASSALEIEERERAPGGEEDPGSGGGSDVARAG